MPLFHAALARLTMWAPMSYERNARLRPAYWERLDLITMRSMASSRTTLPIINLDAKQDFNLF
jgi:hypothetical protein